MDADEIQRAQRDAEFLIGLHGMGDTAVSRLARAFLDLSRALEDARAAGNVYKRNYEKLIKDRDKATGVGHVTK